MGKFMVEHNNHYLSINVDLADTREDVTIICDSEVVAVFPYEDLFDLVINAAVYSDYVISKERPGLRERVASTKFMSRIRPLVVEVLENKQ